MAQVEGRPCTYSAMLALNLHVPGLATLKKSPISNDSAKEMILPQEVMTDAMTALAETLSGLFL